MRRLLVLFHAGTVGDKDKTTLQQDANEGEDAVGWILKKGGKLSGVLKFVL